MTSYWADVSEFQVPVDDSYPYRMIAVRSNDGTYRDHNWTANIEWCRRAADVGRIDCFIAYCVYRENWQETLDTFAVQVGTPHPKMVAMVDVESWDGQIVADQSASANALVAGLARLLGEPRRVIGYGNVADLTALWPGAPAGLRLVVAAYSSVDPAHPGQIAWQYTDGTGHGSGPQGAPPFGACDMNTSALSTAEVATELGVGDRRPTAPAPIAMPPETPKPAPAILPVRASRLRAVRDATVPWLRAPRHHDR